MQRIPLNEVRFHPHSFGDKNLRLFQWNGGLYRGISSERAAFFERVLQDDMIQGLIEQGDLIASEKTSLLMDGYEMVVSHEVIPYASYPHEWCAAMFKDAALCLIDMAIELAQHGLTLADAHPWNLLFDVGRRKPVFVDLGSIQPINSLVWTASDEFYRFCLYPLVLMSQGQDRIARLLLCEDEGVLKSDVSALTGELSISAERHGRLVLDRLESVLQRRLPPTLLRKIRISIDSISSFFSRGSQHSEDQPLFVENMLQKAHLSFLEGVRQELRSIPLPSFNAEPSGPYREDGGSLLLEGHCTAKQSKIHKILTDTRPSSVLDVGCNTGWYSKLAAELGSQVVSWDTDPRYVSQLYYDARDLELAILPVVMDFTNPTPSRGLGSHIAIAASERFQCDMILLLGLVHRLVGAHRLDFDQLAEGLALLSNRWAVVEFIPYMDEEMRQFRSARIAWYTIDNLVSALRKRFGSISMIPSSPEGRMLLLCEK